MENCETATNICCAVMTEWAARRYTTREKTASRRWPAIIREEADGAREALPWVIYLRGTDMPIRPIGTETTRVVHDARPVPVGERQRRSRGFRNVALLGRRCEAETRLSVQRLLGTIELSIEHNVALEWGG